MCPTLHVVTRYAAFQLGLAVVSLVVWPNKFDEILIEEDVDDADAALLDNKQCDGDASTTKTATYGSSATPKPAPATPASPTSSEYRAPTPQSRHDAEDATGNGGGEGYVSEAQHRSPPDRSQVSFGTVRTMGKEESVVSLSPSLVSPPSFLDQLRDIRFILQVVVFSVMLLPAQFYIGNIGSQVGRIADSRSTVSDYSRYFNLVYSFASLATPALGLLTDRVGFAGTYLVVTALYIGSFAIITWVHDLPWWFASFVVYVCCVFPLCMRCGVCLWLCGCGGDHASSHYARLGCRLQVHAGTQRTVLAIRVVPSQGVRADPPGKADRHWLLVFSHGVHPPGTASRLGARPVERQLHVG